MNAEIAKQILDKIVGQIFGFQNPYTLEQFSQKYAFDVRLPSQVTDITTGQPTWASSTNSSKFVTMENSRKMTEATEGLIPTRQLTDIQSILDAWNQTNFMSTERQIESLNVAESDGITGSENVYRSQDINNSKNVLFTDGGFNNEFMAACQRTNTSNFCIRTDDSRNCSLSFSVVWSNKVTRSMFINDCFDVTDCMFCTNMAGKQYCVANMQYDEAEYKRLHDMVVRWVLTN
jgi:hypothetical protein